MARDIPSIEQGIAEAFKILKDIGIEEAIKKNTGKIKSGSYFRSCSDPDTAHKIDHIDSLAIDYECLEVNGSTPMLSAHEALVAKHLDKIKGEQSRDVNLLMNDLGRIIGDFQSTIHGAQAEDSPGGVEFTAEERVLVNKAIRKLESILLYLKITIGDS
tara:strand:- start:897 stop:1373 length:477 start_codon:yes stop_codon:yes gene_type:complete